DSASAYCPRLAPATLLGINDLAAACANRGQYAEAESLYNSILETYRRLKSEQSPPALLAMGDLAGVYVHQKKFDRAAELYEKTLALGAGVLSPDHVTLQSAQAGLAQVRREQGDVHEAERL